MNDIDLTTTLHNLAVVVEELRQQISEKTITPRRQWYPASSGYTC